MITVNHYKVDPSQSLKHTLSIIKDLENRTVFDPEFKYFVHQTFKKNCVECYPKLIHKYIVENFIYSDDKFDEVIQAGYILIKSKTGDCDDFSLFAKSVLRVLNIPSKYILFGRDKGKFSHIAVVTNSKLIDGTNVNFNDWKTIFKKYNYYLYG